MTGLIAVAAIPLAPKLWRAHLARRDAAFATESARVDVAARLAAHEARLIAHGVRLPASSLEAVVRSLPADALAGGRVLYLADPDGAILAASAPLPDGIQGLSDLFAGRAPRLLATTQGGGLLDTSLRNGQPAVAAIRPLEGGYLAVVQPRASFGPGPFGLGTETVGLALVTLLGMAGSGAACLRYRRHARMLRLDRSRLALRLETSLAEGRCGLWDWDVARGRIYWSASMYALLGYDRRGEFLSADEAAAILRPETGDLRALVETASFPGVIAHDLRARTATGDWLWLRLTGETVHDPNDGGRHVIGFAVDVTEERAEAARRASEATRLRDSLEALSEAFVLWDADDRLILCNSKFLRLHGIPPELAAPGTSSQSIFAASRPPLVEKELSGSSQDPDSRTIETQLSDGRWLHINERRTREGGVVSVGTDVSELKLNEARLRERERRLRGSVRAAETAAQRYAALAERNYEANVAKTEFLARMSHELRTPLNAIIGFSDMMRQELLGPLGAPRYGEYTRDIHASGLKLLETIEAILQMSRLEKGQIVLSPQLVAFETIVAEVVDQLEPEAVLRDVAVEVDVKPPALLHADPLALREITTQLLRNAVKFSLPGHPVRVRVRSVGSHLNLYVEDSGIGIGPDVLPRLGRPFEQVEAEYSRGDGGPGLGLAITRALVEMHGGRLRLRSLVGVGTIAMVHIPLVQPAANDPAEDSPDPRPSRPLLVAAPRRA